MLKVIATQWSNQSSGRVDVPNVVGYFPIPEGTPAFTPVKVGFVQTEVLNRGALTQSEAWVAHDGEGNVLGDFENDTEYFGDPGEYLPQNDCESNLFV